jgi:hypothetical protein
MEIVNIQISKLSNLTIPKESQMKWYHYLFCFFAGAFIGNAIPHFIHGVSGDGFPSPFANPPGKGLSSPLVNVLWGLANIVVGYLFFRAGKVSRTNNLTVALFFAGFVCISIMCSIVFVDKMH